MWSDALGQVTSLLGALAAFLTALGGVWLGVRKFTSGSRNVGGVAVETGTLAPAAFDYQAEWKAERGQNEKLRLELAGVYTERNDWRVYAHKLELLLARNNIPF